MILSQFQNIGHNLSVGGLVPSTSGNLSIRLGDRIIITRRGSQMGCLQEHDLIETGLTRNDRHTPLASTELAVHRTIYLNTPALAIVHAHPPHAIALSLVAREIVPGCMEGQKMLGTVPVLGWNTDVKAGGLADDIARELKERRVLMVHGHGSFATGQLLEEAYNYTATLEANCQVICLLKSLGAASRQ